MKTGLETQSVQVNYRTKILSLNMDSHFGQRVVTDNLHLQGTYTWAHVEFAMDYYAFGSEMPGRQLKFPSNGFPNYRYGFNGKEKDPEAAWGDTSYDYGFRIYNPRYARFLSVDPLTSSYPWYSPYQFAGNKPIWAIDLDDLEEADPQQLKMAEQYYQKTKLKQSEFFPNIAPSVINKQVKARFRALGHPINQGKFFLCGPAAAFHIAASHDPKAYVQTVFELYLNGFANGRAIEGNKPIYNAKPDLNGNIDGIAAVDWIMLNSLRFSENAIDWGGYDPHSKDDFNKMTFKNEFVDLVSRTGANVKFLVSNQALSSTEDLNVLSDWINGGKRAVLFINSLEYRGQNSGSGIEGWLSRNYGRHFIVIKEITQDKDGRINIGYWDYGNKGLKHKTFDSFNDFKKSSFNYWLIKNNGQDEN